MKLLLDTHAFIWADGEPQKLSLAAKAACEDPANRIFLSASSVWEMQLKLMLGKLTLRKATVQPSCLILSRAMDHRSLPPLP